MELSSRLNLELSSIVDYVVGPCPIIKFVKIFLYILDIFIILYSSFHFSLINIYLFLVLISLPISDM